MSMFMPQDLPPTSPEFHLRDTLYALGEAHREFREEFGIEREMAVAGYVMLDDCMMFRDVDSGNRIAMTDLPLEEGEFERATVIVDGAPGLVSFSSEGVVVRAPKLVFYIDEQLQATVGFGDGTGAHKIDSGDLAQYLDPTLDLPNIKPLPVSEQDPRYLPPIWEKIAPDPEEETIETMREFYEEAIRDDVLIVPFHDAYTDLSAFMDRHKDTGFGVPNLLFLEGEISPVENNQYKGLGFSLEITEDLEVSREGQPLFERDFGIVFTSHNGAIDFPGRLAGKTELFGDTKQQEVQFELSRDGLSLIVFSGGEEVRLVPDQQTIDLVGLAISSAVVSKQ